jgi:uncharacterized protein (TIGR02996 family)
MGPYPELKRRYFAHAAILPTRTQRRIAGSPLGISGTRFRVTVRISDASVPTKHDLVANVIAHPNDDEPRLVYADVLTAEGDPHGELIIIQCELARARARTIDELVFLPREDPSTFLRCARLMRRQNELLALHRERWVVDALGFKPAEYHRVDFERGFPQDVTLHSKEVVRGVKHLLERSPLRALEILHTAEPDIQELAKLAKQSLSSLRVLKLLEHQKLTSETRATLLDVAPALEHLELRRPSVIDVPTLGRASSSLKTLDIGWADLDADAVDALAKLPCARTLRSLGIASARSEAALLTLEKKRFPVLDALDLTATGLTDGMLRGLATTATGVRFPRKLLLGGSKFGVGGSVALMSMPALAAVDELDLKWNELGDDGVRAIADSPHLSALRVLSLCTVRFSDAGARALAQSRSARLRVLDARGNLLGADGVAAIVGSERHTLEDLDYGYRGHKKGRPGDAVLEAVTSESRASSLRRLSMQSAAISNVGAAALAKSIHLADLRSLDLYDNRISDDGVAEIGSSSCLKSLVELQLLSNRLSDRGAAALAAGCAFEHVVRLRLWLTGWQPGRPVFDDLRARLGEGLLH